MTQTTAKTNLLSIAKKINELAGNLGISKKGDDNIRVMIGRALHAVQQRFGKFSTPMFRKWCYDNVHKADGKPFSHVTLTNYIKYAKNPTLMPKERERQRVYAKNRTKAMKYLSGDNPVNGANQAEQVNRLVYAWDHATSESRNQFMFIAKVKYV